MKKLALTAPTELPRILAISWWVNSWYPQDQRRALLGRKALNRRAHLDGALAPQDPFERILAASILDLRRLDRFGRRTLHRQPIETGIHAHPVQPRAERRIPFEIPEALERPDEHILRQIRRVSMIADKAVAELVTFRR
jgi:hypothetical protein